MNKIILFVWTILIATLAPFEVRSEKQKNVNKNFSVFVPESGETKSLNLKSHQSATIKVYLSTLGEQVDKYMISLIKIGESQVIANALTDNNGEVVFKKVPVGNYTVFLNKKVNQEENEYTTVKIGDFHVKAVP